MIGNGIGPHGDSMPRGLVRFPPDPIRIEKGPRMALALVFAIASIGAEPVEASRPFLTLDPGGHTAQVARVVFTPDGRQVLTISLDKSIRVWDVKTARTLRVLRPPVDDGYEGSLYTAALSRDGRLLAVGGYNKPGRRWGHIHLIDLAENRLVRTLAGHTHDVIALAFSPDGKWLASGSRDNTAILWDVSTGAHRHVLRAHKGHVWGLAFSPDNLRLATGSHDGTARVWEVETGREVFSLNGHADKVNCVAWSPDGRTIATGGFDQRAVLYNQDGSIRQTYQPMGNVVTSLSFAADSRRLLMTLGGAASAVKTCHVLDLTQGRWLSRFERHDQSVIAGDIAPGGDLAVTADGDGIVYVWRTADGSPRGPALVGRSKINWSAGWSHDGRSLSWGNTDRRDSIEQLNPPERSFRPADLAFGGRPGAGFSGAQQKLGPLTTRYPRGPEECLRPERQRVTGIVETPRRVFRRSRALLHPATRRPCRGRDRLQTLPVRFAYGQSDPHVSRAHRPCLCGGSRSGRRYFVSASGDMTLAVWSPDSDRPLLSFFFAEDEWIAWTPEGYYAASLGGEQLMGWQVNNGPGRMATYYPATQFRKTLYRPDVIKQVLEAGSTARALEQADRQSGRPSALTEVAKVLPPAVRLVTPAGSGLRMPAGVLDVRADAVPAGGRPVTSMRLLVNGRPHAVARTLFRDARPAEVTASWKVDLPPGVHRLSAKAASEVSDAISDEVEVIVPGANPDQSGVTATLYLVAVGINAYPVKGSVPWMPPSPMPGPSPNPSSVTARCCSRMSRSSWSWTARPPVTASARRWGG